MQEYQLIRNASTPQGTTGVLWTKAWKLYTIELPWFQNQRDISCISEGTYFVRPFQSPKHGHIFLLENVPGRGEIEIHIGNWAGDVSRGFRSDSKGCILIGTELGELAAQKAVKHSRTALHKLHSYCQDEVFKLKILYQEDL